MNYNGNDNKVECELCPASSNFKKAMICRFKHTNQTIYKCDVCNQEFFQLDGLNMHKKKHQEDVSYSNEFKEFSRDTLLKHIYQMYESEKLFMRKINCKRFNAQVKAKDLNEPRNCKFCSETFNGRIKLKKHIIEKHNSKKSYPCNICKASLMYRSGWIRHMKKHSGEKRFKCDVCSRAFIQKVNLARHFRTHSNTRTRRVRQKKSFTLNNNIRQ